MFFNLNNQFDPWEEWPGGSGAVHIETFMVTENGLEVMSKLPRTLVVVWGTPHRRNARPQGARTLPIGRR
jgi:hypothetical protein